jgi:hypothetical protein
MKTTTITREYDEEGRVTREIRVEVEHPERVVVDSGQWWKPQPGWWQYPVITYGTTSGNPAALTS